MSGTLHSVTLRNAQKNKYVLLTSPNVAVMGLSITHNNSYDGIYSRFYSVSLVKFWASAYIRPSELPYTALSNHCAVKTLLLDAILSELLNFF